MTTPVQTILTRRPGQEIVSAELTFMERNPIQLSLAEAQHKAYATELAEISGASVAVLDPLATQADGCFVEDVLLALPEVFVICRPGAASRRGEVSALEDWLATDRPHRRIEAPATLEGGDVLRDGKTLFVGLSTRTNRAGIEALKEAVTPFGYKVVPVSVTGALHLKTAVTVAAPGVVVINEDWVDGAPFASYTKINVFQDEPFAGNCLRLDESVLMQRVHRKTAARLAEFATVHLVDIGEFAKAEAGLTCLSVVIPQPAT